MKKLILFISLCFPCFVFAQIIQRFGIGTDSFTNPGQGIVKTVFVDSSNNMLYAGGSFEYAGGILSYGIAKWDGNTWDSLSCGIRRFVGSGISEGVLDIEKFGEDLVICGNFTKAGGKPIQGIARWNGTEWFDVGGSAGGAIYQMEVYNDELYVVGSFLNIGGIPSKGIAKWNGTFWTDLSQNFESYCGLNSTLYLYTLLHYKGDLYVSGNTNCDVGATNDRVSKRLGNQWVQVGPGLIGGLAWINKLSIFQNKLYVGGNFSTQYNNPDNNIYYLDGNLAYPTAGGVLPVSVWNMFEYEQELYVCGQFVVAGGDSVGRIAKWDGVQWINTGISINRNDGVARFGVINSFAKYNGNLVLAGAFDMINDTLANNIAMVNFGTTTVSSSKATKFFKLYPNPANSTFSIELSDFSYSKSISVYNAVGQLMLPQKTTEKTLDVSSYAKGMYVVEVQTDKGISRQKLIVE